MRARIPEPWSSFLREVDRGLSTQTTAHCLGAFVLHVLWELPRVTGDVDIVEVEPSTAAEERLRLGGEDSALSRRYKLRFHRVTVAEYPEGYASGSWTSRRRGCIGFGSWRSRPTTSPSRSWRGTAREIVKTFAILWGRALSSETFSNDVSSPSCVPTCRMRSVRRRRCACGWMSFSPMGRRDRSFALSAAGRPPAPESLPSGGSPKEGAGDEEAFRARRT